MKFIRNRLVMTSFLLTIFVMLISNLAQAQLMCSQLFQKAPYAEAIKEANALGSFSESFVRQLEKTPEKVSVQSLESGLKLLDRIAKAYFEKAKVQYDLIPEMIEIKNLKDQQSHTLKYFVYKLKGSSEGDAISRMLNGVQINPNLKDYPIQFVMDPLFALRGDSAAVFSWSKKRIVFGADVVTETLAKKRTALRHEIQHYFEQIKLFEGKMTLARLELTNEHAVEDHWYDKMLSADELESHLRDLRFSIAQMKSGLTPQLLANIKQDFQIIKMASDRISGSIDYIQQALATEQLSIYQHEDGSVSVEFSMQEPGVAGSTVARLYLNGLVTKSEFNNQAQIKLRLAQILTWSKQRADAIDKELLTLLNQLSN